MLLEAVRKLTAFYPLSSYQYIGFGSIYFADFSLLHRAIGIGSMVSIEQNFSAKERVNFNKPFSCIDVIFDQSINVLPKLNLNKPSIIWLDYDGKLTNEILSDINTIIANIKTGGLFLLTVNVKAESEDGSGPEALFKLRLKKLEEQVSKAKIPVDVKGKDLSQKKLPSIIHRIITDEIREALLNRNSGLSKSEKIEYCQLFNFLYEDGSPMLTVGGVLLSDSQRNAYRSAEFENLDFYRSGEDFYQIEVPSLTTKEIVFLDSVLHKGFDFSTNRLINTDEVRFFIPENDIINYAKIYRYYPTFAEAIW